MTLGPRTPFAKGARVAVVGIAAMALAGCGSELGAPEPATEQGETVIDLWRALLLAATLLGLVVVVLATIAVVRFRRRGDDDGELPPQRRESWLLEAAYIAIPFGVVAGFFVYTLRTDDIVTERIDDPDLVVDVTGFRWGWRFEYPEEQVVLESVAGEELEVVLPVGAEVRFRMESSDVIHSLFVPEFLTKRDLVPGLPTELDVELTRTGEFLGHCAEYCGLDHARMNLLVAVVEPEAFEAWLADLAEEG